MKTVKLSLAQAVSDYLLNVQGRHLSQNTVNDYTNKLRKFQIYLADNPNVEDITKEDISNFLSATDVSNSIKFQFYSIQFLQMAAGPEPGQG